jgi:dethiobiotin synthetase
MASKVGFLVSGTDTGVGKTTVGCGLAMGFRELGLRVGVMKPAETGCESEAGQFIAADAIALRAAANTDDLLELICPYRYATPLAPAAAAEAESSGAPDMAQIRLCYERLAAANDLMLLEGAGGLAVPITWGENYADLALALDLDLILVVNNRLGCLNAAVLSLDYAVRRGVRVAGYILNDAAGDSSPAARSNGASMRRLTTIRCLGEIGHGAPVPLEVCRQLLSSIPH